MLGALRCDAREQGWRDGRAEAGSVVHDRPSENTQKYGLLTRAGDPSVTLRTDAAVGDRVNVHKQEAA